MNKEERERKLGERPLKFESGLDVKNLAYVGRRVQIPGMSRFGVLERKGNDYIINASFEVNHEGYNDVRRILIYGIDEEGRAYVKEDSGIELREPGSEEWVKKDEKPQDFGV